jgi:adenylate cyclase class IV
LDSYIRVRKEFDKITLTYKCNLKSKYVDEYEILVSDYDTTIKMLNKMGLNKKYSIQKLREKWSIKGCSLILL